MALVLELSHLCPSGLFVNGTTTLGRVLVSQGEQPTTIFSQSNLTKFLIPNPPVTCD
jgi:hypothetical protein